MPSPVTLVFLWSLVYEKSVTAELTTLFLKWLLAVVPECLALLAPPPPSIVMHPTLFLSSLSPLFFIMSITV